MSLDQVTHPASSGRVIDSELATQVRHVGEARQALADRQHERRLWEALKLPLRMASPEMTFHSS